MYGTVARMRVKAGAEEQFMALLGQYSQIKIPGYRASLAYRMDADAREVYLSVVFDSKEDYERNADSPEQDARYREMLALLEGAPEWRDGEIVSDANIVHI